MNQLNLNNGDGYVLRYEIVKNALREKNAGEISYCARVHASVKSLRELAETMVREGSKYKSSEIFAILQDFTDLTIRLLQEGYAVNVGSLVRFRPSIRGKFTSENDTFTRGVHRIIVRSATGSILRNVAASTTVERISATTSQPQISIVYNSITGKANTVCSNGTLSIQGVHLAWNRENPEEGFFVTLDGATQQCEVLHVNEADTHALLKLPHELQEGNSITLSFRTRTATENGLFTTTYSTPLQYESIELSASE